jgi:hypothetical protein
MTQEDLITGVGLSATTEGVDYVIDQWNPAKSGCNGSAQTGRLPSLS